MPDESLFQTVTRNLTPQMDTSKSALGKGGMLTSGDSPQKEGETQYNEKFGSPQEVAYGKLKSWLSDHEQHFSDKVLKPFREGLDNMADQIETSPVVKAASPTAQGVAKGTAELLRQVPVGKDVKSTAVANIGTFDFSGLEGHVLEEEAPQVAYRARPVGQKGVSAGERPVATSSLDKAKTYKENLESMTGQPHEVVQIPLKKGEHTVHAGPDDDRWFSFKKDVPEESIAPHNPDVKPFKVEWKPNGKYGVVNPKGITLDTYGTRGEAEIASHKMAQQSAKAKAEQDVAKARASSEKPEPGAEPDNEREIRTRTQGRPSKPTEPSSQTEPPADHSKLIAQVNKKDWWHVPPAEGNAAYQKRGQFFSPDYKTAEFYGRPLDDAQKVQIQKPLVGDEQAIAKELGVAPQKEGMTREQIAAHDEKWAKAAKQKGYDSIALMSPQGWAEYQKTGKVPKDVELNTLHQVGSSAEKKIATAKEGLGK
jgi:hypothetical protein